MTHRRTQIADNRVAALAAIPEFSGEGKVARGRASSIPQERLPALTVTWGEAGESADRRAFAGPAGEDGYDRRLPLSVLVHLRDEDAENEFDRICELVEPVMEADVTLGGLAVELTLQSTRLYIDPRTGLPLGVGSLNYQVFYKTLAADPGVSAI